MRIADKMSFAQLNKNLSKNRQEMNKLQGEAATQKRVNRPSDDPVASHRILAARTELQGIDQYMKNISTARTFLEYSDQALGELTDVLVRAKELAVGQASDGGTNEEARRVAASEVEQLRWQAIQVGNRKFGERYIFGGFRTEHAPFDQMGGYKGDSGDMKIQVDKDSFLSMNMPGNKVFLGDGLGRDGVVRADSETPQTAEEIKEYRKKNRAIHSGNNPHHDGPKGHQKDDEREEVDSQPIRSLATVMKAQSEQTRAEETDGHNVFQVLQNFQVSLMSGDRQGVQESLDELDSAINQVINARAQVGARVSSLDRTFESMQKAKVDNQTTKSEMEDADLFSVISDINKTESALQATLQTSNKMIQPSLLDFLK